MADKPATALQPEADPSGWVDDHGDYLFRYAVFRLGHAEAADSESTGMVSRRSDPASGARAWAESLGWLGRTAPATRGTPGPWGLRP
jgi:hypothetical protein